MVMQVKRCRLSSGCRGGLGEWTKGNEEKTNKAFTRIFVSFAVAHDASEQRSKIGNDGFQMNTFPAPFCVGAFHLKPSRSTAPRHRDCNFVTQILSRFFLKQRRKPFTSKRSLVIFWKHVFGQSGV
jgi:hypothetical protein